MKNVIIALFMLSVLFGCSKSSNGNSDKSQKVSNGDIPVYFEINATSEDREVASKIRTLVVDGIKNIQGYKLVDKVDDATVAIYIYPAINRTGGGNLSEYVTISYSYVWFNAKFVSETFDYWKINKLDAWGYRIPEYMEKLKLPLHAGIDSRAKLEAYWAKNNSDNSTSIK